MHAMFPTRNKSIRKAKISESALVEKLTDSLNSFIEKNPPIAKSEDASHANVDKKQASQVTASQNATKNFLAGKTLLKNIAKACTKENITLGDDNESNIFVESLVDNYKTNYPLSARSLIDALKKTAGNSIETSKNLDVSLPSVIDKVDALMEEYQTRIRLLKRRREEDATKPTEVEEPKPKKARGPNEDRKSAIVEKKDKRGRKTHFNPDTPEGEVLTKILEKYSKERESNSRVEIARLQEIVDEVKAEGGYDWFDMPKEKLSRKVRRRYLANPEASSRQKDILDDMYGRYVKAKEDSGSKISKGKLESIFEEVKQERGGKFDMKVSPAFNAREASFQAN